MRARIGDVCRSAAATVLLLGLLGGSPASAQERVRSPEEELEAAETAMRNARSQGLCADRIHRTDRALRRLRAAIAEGSSVPQRTRTLVEAREGLDDCLFTASGGRSANTGAPSPSSTVVLTRTPTGAGVRPAAASNSPASPSRRLLRETWAEDQEGPVLAELRRRDPQVRGCVETARAAGQALPPMLTLQFLVGPSGELRDVHVLERAPQSLIECLSTQARAWRIAEPGEAIATRFRYQIHTGAAEAAAPSAPVRAPTPASP